MKFFIDVHLVISQHWFRVLAWCEADFMAAHVLRKGIKSDILVISLLLTLNSLAPGICDYILKFVTDFFSLLFWKAINVHIILNSWIVPGCQQ